MKKALFKDFFMEIRKSKARFLSIFFIVALGVAFFSGIQAASPDMRSSGDVYYDEQNLMDLKLISTLGLTDKDVDSLSQLDSIEYAEGGFFEDVLCGDGENQKVLHIESYSDAFNVPKVGQGRVPEHSGECFVDDSFAGSNHLQLGDILTVKEEGDSGRLTCFEYEIVGIGQSPLYISFNRGNTNLGSGEVNGFMLISPDDFDPEVYTQIYIKAHGADQLISYTDAYEDVINRTKEEMKSIEQIQCQYRYDSIVNDALEELAEGEQELEDGKAEAHEELHDAHHEISDGMMQYLSGKSKYLNGKKAYEDGKEQLEDGKQQLLDGINELEDGKKELEDVRKKLEDGRQELASGRQEYKEGYATLAANQSEVDQGWVEIQNARTQLEDARKQIEDGRQQLEDGKKELEDNEIMLNDALVQIHDGEAQIAEGEKQIADGEAQIAEGEIQIANGKEQLETLIYLADLGLQALDYALENELITEDIYTYSLEQLQIQIQNLNDQYDMVLAEEQELIAARQELESGKQDLLIKKQELADNLAQVEAGLAEIEIQKGVIAEKEQELMDGEAAYLEAEAAALPEIEANELKLYDAQAQLDEGWAQLAQAQAQIQSGEQELADGQRQYVEGEKQLYDGKKQIDRNRRLIMQSERKLIDSEQELLDAEQELKDADKELRDGIVEFNEGKTEASEKIHDAEEEIADAKQKIDDIPFPEWMINTRNDLPEYSDYGDNAERIRNLGQVFPVIFFLVAALISLTTMARMVEDQRTQIGTMKALGYGKGDIIIKYVGYALLATVGGSILGVLIGEKILPWVIITAYGIMYRNAPSRLAIDYEWKFALIASGAAVLCTVGATLVSCLREVVETPASLMRPPAPKKGKKILLERIPFIWKNLNFTWKSSMRNLFRYKKRLFMTIFGIAGSMGLMLIGFGLHDSIMDVALKQYEEIQHYDGTIIHDEDTTAEEVEALQKYLEENDQIALHTNIELTKMAVTNGHYNLSSYVYVPENLQNFAKDVTLKNRVTGAHYEMSDAGAAICEKTATLMGVEVGDTITIQKDNKNYEVPVAVVTENYMGHYVYMTPALYKEVFGKDPKYVDTVFTVKDEYKDVMEEVGRDILTQPAALSISYTASLAGTIYRMLTTLGLVVVVLIVSAGLLAFVVLYNLNNINITERQRELATLKVLGFYDREVSSYVFRENIVLTIAGIVAGAFFGIMLHRFTITTVEVDAVMFGRDIKPLSFVYCALLTTGFSLIVNLFMHQKLKKINMVESLKSVE